MPQPRTVVDAASEQRVLATLVAAGAGDTEATTQFVVLITPLVRRVVGRIFWRSHPDLDDTVQQALLAILGALRAFRGESSPTSYVVGIAARVAGRAHARALREIARREKLAGWAAAERALDAPVPAPEAIGRRRLMRALLAEIPREQAEALTLCAVWGFTSREVACHSGAPSDTVRGRARSARLALRSKLLKQPAWLAELRGASATASLDHRWPGRADLDRPEDPAEMVE